MIEKALVYSLAQAVPELSDDDSIYPTNAPEKSKKPYLVYRRTDTELDKTLDGFTGKRAVTFVFDVMASKYEDMKPLAKKVEAFLVALPKTYIGESGSIYVEDLDINNISDTYENELKVNRGILDFTVYF